jgi:hypothetical protein
VYAVAPVLRGRLATTGLAGERVKAVAVGSIAAFVGEMPRVPRPDESHLREYDRVLKALSRRSAALLPARYGTTVSDEDELHLILRSRQASLRRQLKNVRNRVQMTLRIPGVDPPVARIFQVRPTRSTKPDSGAEYLRSRAHEAAQARDIPQLRPLRASVRRWVKGERVEQRGAIATAYHLVPRGSVDAYRRALARRAAEAGVRIVITGPWPPYAFADPLD